jgi:putative peptidoglycan lipid II flippase
MCLFGVLGASVYNSAFIFAFAFPNLFRRLWGEGALTSAFVPVFAQQWSRGPMERAFQFLNVFLARFALFLGATCTVGILCLLLISDSSGPQWSLGLRLSALLMPYMALVCFSAILNAALNVLGNFKILAFSPVLLNCVMIFSLGTGVLCSWSMGAQTVALCFGVLVGGVLQCAWPARALRAQRWKPRWVTIDSNHREDLRRLWKLFLPALLGAAVYQINIFVGRLLAFGLDESATSILYLANRFVEVPLGIFCAAITTVVLPGLSLMISKKRWEDVELLYGDGLSLMVTVLLPAAVGLYLLGEPLLRLFFAWGKFSSNDLKSTVPVLKIFAISLPFCGVSSLMIRSFHAQQNTRIPAKIAAYTLVLHVVLALLAMRFFRTAGLAIASTLATILQTLWLGTTLSRQNAIFRIRHLGPQIVRWSAATVVMGLFTRPVAHAFLSVGRWSLFGRLTVIVIASIAVYAIGLNIVDPRTATLWTKIFSRRDGNRNRGNG